MTEWQTNKLSLIGLIEKLKSALGNEEDLALLLMD